MQRQNFVQTGRSGEFKLEALAPQQHCGGFQCAVSEYNEYLVHDALRSMSDHIALTWLLIERTTGKIAAYMSLIMDAIKLSFTGIGSFMIGAAGEKAVSCNEDYCAARFLTVDADIEHDTGVLAFYEKNGFIHNSELRNKNRKTISMRKDIYV